MSKRLSPCDQVKPPRSLALFRNTRTYPKECPAFPLIVIVSDEILCITYRYRTTIMIKPGVIMGQKTNNVNKFWLLYRDAVIGSGIPENTAEWYAR